jgi:hypothetical protein
MPLAALAEDSVKMRLQDNQGIFDLQLRHSTQEVKQQSADRLGGQLPHFDHDNARRLSRWVEQDVEEIVITCDQYAVLPLGQIINDGIRCSRR